MKVVYYNDEKLNGLKTKHLESLIDFIRVVWDKDMTVGKFFAKREYDFKNNPYMSEGGSPITMIIENDKVLGHCMSTPCGLWAEGQESVMYWNSGLFLSPKCRGKGWGKVLPEKLKRELPIVNGFFVVPQQLKTHKKLGYHIVGKLPEYIKLLKPYRFFSLLDLSQIHQMPNWLKKITNKKYSLIRKPAALIVSLVYHLYKQLHKLLSSIKLNQNIKSNQNIKFVDEFDERLDNLWDSVKKSIKYAQVRNSKYVNWQFRKDNGWIKLIYENGNEIEGYAILAIKQFEYSERLAGMKVVSIIDLAWKFNKPEILNKMLNFIESFANKQNIDLIIFSINHQDVKSIIRSKAYLKIPSTVYFAIHSSDEKTYLSPKLDDWFLTRGDADAAGTLRPEITR